MDPKSNIPSSSYESEEPAPPPSYLDSVSTGPKQVPEYAASSSTSQYYSSQIQSQLQDLTTTIASLQTQKALLSHAQDEKILSLLTHQIQIYLLDFAKSGLNRGTLILVPRQGLGDDAALPSHYDFKDPEHYDKVVRLSDKEATSRFRDDYGSYGEADNGQLWFWNDEDMAIRLAGYLRPPKNYKAMPLPPRKEAQQVPKPESSSRGFWSRSKSTFKKEERPPLIDEPRRNPDIEPPTRDGDKVVMDVEAEEVVFRTENDFGLFETKRGWGVVLKLKVNMRGR